MEGGKPGEDNSAEPTTMQVAGGGYLWEMKKRDGWIVTDIDEQCWERT